MTVYFEGLIAYLTTGAILTGTVYYDKEPDQLDAHIAIMTTLFWPGLIIIAVWMGLFNAGRWMANR